VVFMSLDSPAENGLKLRSMGSIRVTSLNIIRLSEMFQFRRFFSVSIYKGILNLK